MAVIKAIVLAWVRDWKHVWLEVDSSLILDFLRSPSLVPWQLRVQWNNCLFRISQMNFHSSHIFREGNHVADALANYGTSSTDFVWWDTTPSFIASNCNEDRLGIPKYRVR
ncbi:putative ribonuclease H-like domain-containing protein [Rosa chinensis]|uniref:Putative ribonuclease H-like domain-containing protein n=1 Tax=Rosa chinensis TaxID=74649 RepID=A0A2P6R823_ROSCH|nr:putative ribonuclease H-like domain-containing protein [Rosa chinensis]